jgi:hypothetical protein
MFYFVSLFATIFLFSLIWNVVTAPIAFVTGMIGPPSISYGFVWILRVVGGMLLASFTGRIAANSTNNTPLRIAAVLFAAAAVFYFLSRGAYEKLQSSAERGDWAGTQDAHREAWWSYVPAVLVLVFAFAPSLSNNPATVLFVAIVGWIDSVAILKILFFVIGLLAAIHFFYTVVMVLLMRGQRSTVSHHETDTNSTSTASDPSEAHEAFLRTVEERRKGWERPGPNIK